MIMDSRQILSFWPILSICLANQIWLNRFTIATLKAIGLTKKMNIWTIFRPCRKHWTGDSVIKFSCTALMELYYIIIHDYYTGQGYVRSINAMLVLIKS